MTNYLASHHPKVSLIPFLEGMQKLEAASGQDSQQCKVLCPEPGDSSAP